MKFALFLLALPLAAQTSFVTSFAPTVLRNDFTGYVGMKFTVGPNPVTVTALGRMCVAGNSQTHIIEIVQSMVDADLVAASVKVNMNGCTPGQYAYAQVQTLVTGVTSAILTAGGTYYLATQETAGGDRWYDQGAIQTTVAATVISSIYQYNGTWYSSTAHASYGPISFQYGGAVAPAPAAPPSAGVTMALGPNQCTLTPQVAGTIQVVCQANSVTVYTATQNIGSGSEMDGKWVFSNGTISWQLSPGTGNAVNYSITNGSAPKLGAF